MKAERVVDLERYRRMKEKGRITPRAAVVRVQVVEDSVASSLSGASQVVPSVDSSNETGRIPIASPYVKEAPVPPQLKTASTRVNESPVPPELEMVFGCPVTHMFGETIRNESPLPQNPQLSEEETVHREIYPGLSREETVRRTNTASTFEKYKRQRFEGFKNKVQNSTTSKNEPPGERNSSSTKNDPPGIKSKKGPPKKKASRLRKQTASSKKLPSHSGKKNSDGSHYDKYDSFAGIPSPPSNLLSVASPQPVNAYRPSYATPFLQESQTKGGNKTPTTTLQESQMSNQTPTGRNLPSFGDTKRERKPVPDNTTSEKQRYNKSSPFQRQQLKPESRRQRQKNTGKKELSDKEYGRPGTEIKHQNQRNDQQPRLVQKKRNKPNLVVNPSSTPTSKPPPIIFESLLDSHAPSPPLRPPISNQEPLLSLGSSQGTSRSSKRDRIMESRGEEEEEQGNSEIEKRDPLNETRKDFAPLENIRLESHTASLQTRQNLERPSLVFSHSPNYQKSQWADPKPPRQARGTKLVELYQRLSAEKSKQAAMVKSRFSGGGVTDPLTKSYESKKSTLRATQNFHSDSPQSSASRRQNPRYSQNYCTESQRSSEDRRHTQRAEDRTESPESSGGRKFTPRVSQKYLMGSPRSTEDQRYTPRASQIYRIESPQSIDTPVLDQRTVRLLYSAEFSQSIRYKTKYGLHELLNTNTTMEILDHRQQNGVFFAARKRPLLHDELKRGEFDIIKTEDDLPDVMVVFKTSVLPDRKSKNIEPSVHIFDHISSESCSEDDFYRQVIQPGIFKAIDGGTSTVIVYGSHGSGKTHTMADIEEKATYDLFEVPYHTMHSEQPVYVLIQYLEISDTQIVDLLGPVGTFVRIIEEEGGYNFKGAVVKTTSSPDELLDILSDAKRRLARATAIRKKQDGHNYLLCQIEIHHEWGHGSLTLLECPTETMSSGVQSTFDGLMNSICARSSGQIENNPFRDVNNVTKALQFTIEDPSSDICLVATVSPAATCTESTLTTLSSLSNVINSQPTEGFSMAESSNFSQQENVSPKNIGHSEELTLPRQWSHEELVGWMQRKNLLGNPVPSDVNGRFAMRMSKRQLQNTFYDVFDHSMAEKLFIALRAENDRVARQRVKLRMARDRQRLSASY